MDCFEEQLEEHYKKSSFIIRPVNYDGECTRPILSDDEMIRILEFRGTGINRNFIEILTYIEEHNFNATCSNHDNDGKPGYTWIKPIWADEYIIHNNINVTYKDGDILFKKYKST